MIQLISNQLRLSIDIQDLRKKRAKIDPFAYILVRKIDTFIFFVSLPRSSNNRKSVSIAAMKTRKNADNCVFVVIIPLIRIFDTMEADSPLSWLIFHTKPGVVASIELINNFQTMSHTFNRLIIRPTSSKLDIFFFISELNVSVLIKIFRR